MENQFSRTELLLGSSALQKLSKARVAVFGIGGVGSYVVEALARSGIGALDLIDNDRISLSNLNRQLFATHKTIGLYKVDVAKKRIAEINPQCIVNTYKTFYLPDSDELFDFSQYDYIVDAVDTVTAKIGLIMAAKQNNVPIISAMGAGNKLNPSMFEVADIYQTSVCPLAHVMRKELKKRGIKSLKVVYSKEKPLKPLPLVSSEADNKEKQQPNTETFGSHKQIPGSISFVPPVVGLIIAGEIVKDITNT